MQCVRVFMHSIALALRIYWLIRHNGYYRRYLSDHEFYINKRIVPGFKALRYETPIYKCNINFIKLNSSVGWSISFFLPIGEL